MGPGFESWRSRQIKGSIMQRLGIGTLLKSHTKGKATSIGQRNIKRSTMNKHKKRSFKKYRGQGK